MTDDEYSDFREKVSGKNNGMYKSGERGIHLKGFKGHHHSIESRKSISEKTSGVHNPFYGKKWEDYGGHPKGFKGHHHKDSENWKNQVSLKITKSNGEILKFSNTSKAVRELNIPRSFLSKMLNLDGVYHYDGDIKYKYRERFDGWLVEKI